MKKYLLCFLLGVAVICGCKKKSSPSLRVLNLKSIDTYCTSDLKTAEQAMLNMKQTINERIDRNIEDDKFGSDLDQMLGAVYARLFLIYDHAGETNNAKDAYQNAAEHMIIYANKQGRWDSEALESLEITDKQMESHIRGVDKFVGTPVWMSH